MSREEEVAAQVRSLKRIKQRLNRALKEADRLGMRQDPEMQLALFEVKDLLDALTAYLKDGTLPDPDLLS